MEDTCTVHCAVQCTLYGTLRCTLYRAGRGGCRGLSVLSADLPGGVPALPGASHQAARPALEEEERLLIDQALVEADTVLGLVRMDLLDRTGRPTSWRPGTRSQGWWRACSPAS